MAQDVPGAVEVEIGVIGDVAIGGLVAGGLVAEGEAPVREGVRDPKGQIAGKALLAVGGSVGEDGEVLAGVGHAEHLGREALRAAVELLRPLVGRQGDARAVDEAGGSGNAVGVPAHHRA